MKKNITDTNHKFSKEAQLEDLLKDSEADEILPQLEQWKNMKLTLIAPEFYQILNQEADLISKSNPTVILNKAVTIVKAIYECLAESK